MVSGVLSMHGRGLVVNDIKPDNFLVGYDGAVKLSDFGYTRPSAVAAATPGYNTGKTHGWAPPEIFSDKPLGKLAHRVDCYSLGLVFFWMLCQQSNIWYDKYEDELDLIN